MTAQEVRRWRVVVGNTKSVLCSKNQGSGKLAVGYLVSPTQGNPLRQVGLYSDPERVSSMPLMQWNRLSLCLLSSLQGCLPGLDIFLPVL